MLKQLILFMFLFTFPTVQSGATELPVNIISVKKECPLRIERQAHTCCDLLHTNPFKSAKHQDCNCVFMQHSPAVLFIGNYVFVDMPITMDNMALAVKKPVHIARTIWEPPRDI